MTALRVRDGNSVAWRRAQIPAASGFGNARSIALVQSALACEGTVRGVRLLSAAGAGRAREEQFSGEDRVIGMAQRYGLGYGLFGNTFGWGGWGGSLVMIDPDARMVVAYATNQMREPAQDTRGWTSSCPPTTDSRGCSADRGNPRAPNRPLPTLAMTRNDE